MLQNYLKVAIRNLWRYKTFSFINIAGLSLGTVSMQVVRAAVANPVESLRSE